MRRTGKNDWRNAELGGEVLPGWVPLVDELYKQVIALDPELTVAQVKEKFGGLRFYYDTSESYQKQGYESFKDPIYLLVSKAEEESFTICEVCGEPGQPVGIGGWTNTLCPQHTEIKKTDGTPAWLMVEKEPDERIIPPPGFPPPPRQD